MQVYNGTNITGIWQVRYAWNYYYLANKPGEQIQYPRNLGNAWVQQIRDREVNLLRYTRLADEASLKESEVPSKMAKLTIDNEMPTVQVTEKQQLISHLSSQSYWDSSEARKLFGAQDEDDVLDFDVGFIASLFKVIEEDVA